MKSRKVRLFRERDWKEESEERCGRRRELGGDEVGREKERRLKEVEWDNVVVDVVLLIESEFLYESYSIFFLIFFFSVFCFWDFERGGEEEEGE